jgi:hypothetical protein
MAAGRRRTDSRPSTPLVTQAKLLYLGNGESSEVALPLDAVAKLAALDTRRHRGAGGAIAKALRQAPDWAFRLEVVKGAPTLFGLWMRNDQDGVRVSKLAASGAASADFYHSDEPLADAVESRWCRRSLRIFT